MRINNGANRQVRFYRRLIMLFNVPMMVLIPSYAEFLLPEHLRVSMSAVYLLLYLGDTFLFFNSLMVYSLLRSVVLAIDYLPQEDKLVVEKLGKRLQVCEEKHSPGDIEKLRKGGG